LFVNLRDSKDIAFHITTIENKKFLTGFSVDVKDSTEAVARNIANEKAARLSNIISVKSGRYVFETLSGFDAIRKGGPVFISSLLTINSAIKKELDLDLNDKRISSILGRNTKTALLYDFVSRGIKAAEDQDPVTMIREFHKVIEETKLSSEKKYRSLRNMVSHRGPLKQETILQVRENFGSDYFHFTGRYFDINSQKNKERLRNAANRLARKVIQYIQEIP